MPSIFLRRSSSDAMIPVPSSALPLHQRELVDSCNQVERASASTDLPRAGPVEVRVRHLQGFAGFVRPILKLVDPMLPVFCAQLLSPSISQVVFQHQSIATGL